jgi:peptidylprolyl isomerase
MSDQRADARSAPPQPPGVRGRGPAWAGAAAGVAVATVLVAVLVGIRATGGGGTDRTAAALTDQGEPLPSVTTARAEQQAAPAPQQPAAVPQAAPGAAAAPAPGNTPDAVTPTGRLAVRPTVGPGRGALTRLVVTPLIKGTGATVRKGQTVTVNYVLVRYADGTQIESSWDAGAPVPLRVGVGRLIQGWDRGLPGQRVGSRIRLDVPAALAYGPSQGDLRFVVDILAAR